MIQRPRALSSVAPIRFLALLLVSPLLLACLWDYDTLKMELAEFPSSVELITGKFRRHSDDFYQWRIEDRTKQLPADLDQATAEHLPLLDDIAVAFDKLGNHARAIEFAELTLRIAPERYESFANRGTFKIHAGNLEAGVADLHRAIEINPDAHFGREIVQIRLVEYLIAERAAGRGTLPLTKPQIWKPSEHGFESYRAALTPPLERKEAVRGLLGMFRFGNHDHPILLDVLGEQLYVEGHKRLAARCYLKASMEVEDPETKKKYLALAKEALDTQTPNPKKHENLSLEVLQRTFQTELDEAEKFFAEIVANERAWIAAGDDVDARYDALYFPEKSSKKGAAKPQANQGSSLSALLLFACGLLVLVGVIKS